MVGAATAWCWHHLHAVDATTTTPIHVHNEFLTNLEVNLEEIPGRRSIQSQLPPQTLRRARRARRHASR